jgi:hypothetical protein
MEEVALRPGQRVRDSGRTGLVGSFVRQPAQEQLSTMSSRRRCGSTAGDAASPPTVWSPKSRSLGPCDIGTLVVRECQCRFCWPRQCWGDAVCNYVRPALGLSGSTGLESPLNETWRASAWREVTESLTFVICEPRSSRLMASNR